MPTRILRADQIRPGDRVAPPADHTLLGPVTVVSVMPLPAPADGTEPHIYLLTKELPPGQDPALPLSAPVIVHEVAPAHTDLLPELPDDPREEAPDYPLEGYAWSSALHLPWYTVNSWGIQGWDLGQWPYQIVAHADLPERDCFGRVTWVEGDATIEAFASRAERDRQTALTAAFWWVDSETGPEGGLSEETVEAWARNGIPPEYAGPYRR
jgi:hypothetical protein